MNKWPMKIHNGTVERTVPLDSAQAEQALIETYSAKQQALLGRTACPICDQKLSKLGCGASDGMMPCSVEQRDLWRVAVFMRTPIF